MSHKQFTSQKYYSDITRASQRLISLATWLFVPQLLEANNEVNIKAQLCITGLLCGHSSTNGCPLYIGPVIGKMFPCHFIVMNIQHESQKLRRLPSGYLFWSVFRGRVFYIMIHICVIDTRNRWYWVAPSVGPWKKWPKFWDDMFLWASIH